MTQNQTQNPETKSTGQTSIAGATEEDAKVAKKEKMKVSDKINIVSQTVIPIVTAVIGAGMFAYSQWYVGQVQVKTPRNYNKIEIHVFNDKGNESVFHTDHFQLTPDHYRFEVTVDQYPNITHDKHSTLGTSWF